MSILIDTNVLSEVRRPQPSPTVMHWLARLDKDAGYVSVVSFAEIRRGVNLLAPGRKKTELASWLDTELPSQFTGRILPIDVPISLAWGDLMTECRRMGVALAPLDGMLAATARVHTLQLATRNTKDFQNLGLTLVDPWQA